MSSLLSWAFGGKSSEPEPEPEPDTHPAVAAALAAARPHVEPIPAPAPAQPTRPKPKRANKVDLTAKAGRLGGAGGNGGGFDAEAELAKVKAREAAADAAAATPGAAAPDSDSGDEGTEVDGKNWKAPPMNAYPPKAPNVVLPAIGSVVVIFGLEAKPEHNGAVGVIEKHIEKKGRCAVKLDDGTGTVLSLKPANLRVQTAAEVAAAKVVEAARKAAPAVVLPTGEGPPPPAPLSITVTGNTLVSLSLEWTPDAAARSSTLYVVELQQEGDNQWHKVYQSNFAKCVVKKGKVSWFPEPLSKVKARVCSISLKRARSSTVETEFWTVQKCIKKGVKGYGPYKAYYWTQDLEEMEIVVPIPGGGTTASAKQYACEIHPGWIKLQKRGDPEPIISGEFNEPVEPEDSFWEFHKPETEGGDPYLRIELYKKAPAWAMLGLAAPSQFWPAVVKGWGVPQIDSADLKEKVPEEVKAGEGKKPMKQKTPYGREAERAGHARYGLDVNASPSHPYDGYQGSAGPR